jgi:hypothetical protein
MKIYANSLNSGRKERRKDEFQTNPFISVLHIFPYCGTLLGLKAMATYFLHCLFFFTLR